MKKFVSPLVFMAIALGIGFLSSWVAPVDGWYDTINKSALTPPGWVFPIAWTILYILIGIAGGIAWNAKGFDTPIIFWGIQAILNGMWSVIFFRWHMPALALFEILILLSIIFAFIFVCWRELNVASLLFVPYALWVSFATYLTFMVVWLN